MTDQKKQKGLKGELESLWKTTVDQFDELTDVLVKTSQAGKARLDATMLRRERDVVLARLGALVRETAPRGDVPDAWVELMREADALDARIAEEEERFDRVFPGRDDDGPTGST